MSIRSRLCRISAFSLRAAGFLAVPCIALAHPGHEHVSNDMFKMFGMGVVHPLTGFDHLFAMVAVGLWAALTHKSVREAIWTPLSFLCWLLIGAVLGVEGVNLPAIEPMIMASLLVLGLLVTSRLSVPKWAGVALVGFFAVFHGIAHGSELPASGSAAAFFAGFMLTTLALHVVGLAAGFKLKNYNVWLTRVAGAGIAAYGFLLLIPVA